MKHTFLLRNIRRASHGGYLMLLALVFGSIFVGLLGALSSFVLIENRLQNVKYSESKAFAIAEAGIEYYRWHLAHYPSDLTNGTGQAGPYTIPYTDPEGGNAGTISLSVLGNTACGQTTSVDLSSTGTAADNTSVHKTVVARYAQPSVATYSYILNDTVWAGSDRVISGPYHSNGGIHMDGTANAVVSSSLDTWTCTNDYGCSATTTQPYQRDPTDGQRYPVVAGVYGTGSDRTLWENGVQQVDFSAISADFSSLKATAQSGGIFLQRISSGNTNSAAYNKGYHLIFNSNGTVTVRKVTATILTTPTSTVNPADDTDHIPDRTLIQNEVNLGTYSIPANCGLIFVEDNAWIEGTISSKVTVVAANVTTSGLTPSAFLRSNIVYNAPSGTAGLTVIAARNILITPDAPQNMTLNGVFIAQGGAFGRNNYGCGNSYEPRGTLTITGTTVSNKRTGTRWLNGCQYLGLFYSDTGYQTRIDSYDRQLASDPPPFTPSVSTDYKLMDWREE